MERSRKRVTVGSLATSLYGVPPDWERPDFASEHRVHNWRNYVPEEVAAMWSSLSLETRLIAAVIAERAAGQEEWD